MWWPDSHVPAKQCRDQRLVQWTHRTDYAGVAFAKFAREYFQCLWKIDVTKGIGQPGGYSEMNQIYDQVDPQFAGVIDSFVRPTPVVNTGTCFDQVPTEGITHPATVQIPGN